MILQRSPREDRIFSIVAWAVVLILGAVQALATRFSMNADGVSYLELSDRYARADWSNAVNGYWSPLYPFLLGLVRRIHEWPPFWESSAAHTVNVGIYLLSFAAFLFMLRELQLLQRDRTPRDSEAYIPQFENRFEKMVACALFLWAALVLIGVTPITPDMSVAAENYVIAGLMLRSMRLRAAWSHAIILGAVLGISYLTKAVMFPVAFLVILGVGWSPGTARWSVQMRVVCAVIF